MVLVQVGVLGRKERGEERVFHMMQWVVDAMLADEQGVTVLGDI